MSNFLKKSKKNYSIAIYLKDERQCFTPVIHCWYYSCIQIISHIFKYVFSESENEITQNARSYKISTHSYLIREITADLHFIDKKDALSFERKISELKELRNYADYKDELITEKQANDALTYTNQLRKILSKHYDVRLN